MNSSNEDKERDAIRFVKEYKDKIDEFITFTQSQIFLSLMDTMNRGNT